ncbi:MAG: hypothetical protein LDL31_11090, partial [Prosthecobacter sp.]|nr:hypothetical protein [Prosthecobacter sp.]
MDHLPAALKCPNCASPIREQDYDLEQGTIRCGYCGTLMLPPRGQRSSAVIQRPQVALPAKMSLERTAHGIVIKRRWINLSVLFLIPFCIVWDSFVFGFVGMMSSSDEVPWFVRLFPMGHVAAGIGITYYTLALLLNKTRVDANHGVITVSHGPLPWAGWREIVAGRIEQIYCKEIIHRGKNGVTTSYEGWVQLNDGTHTRLVAAGMEADQAL